MRYIHIIFSFCVHTKNFIELVNNSFDEQNHLFISSSEELLSMYPNNHIVYQEKINIVDVVKKYSDNSTAIIFHSLNIPLCKLFLLKKKDLKKIVWVVWGHDLYVTEEYGLWGRIKTFLKIFRQRLKYIKLKNLCAIGIGFKYDALEIRRHLSDVPILNMLYFQPSHSDMDFVPNKIISNKPIKIMVGHSSFKFLNHKLVLKRLSKFKDNNIMISLVLSYGSKEYAGEVISFARDIFGDNKVEVLKEKLSFNEYINYMKSVDISILDYKHQSALGNFFLLMYLGKKIYLNSKGVLYQSAILDGWKPYSVEEIDHIDFIEFSKPCDLFSKHRMKEVAKYYYDRDIAVQNWSISFQEIERIINSNE